MSELRAPLRLFNTLTRTVEPFAPADGHTVRMYTCGPTVYNPAHLGNFRTFLFEDLLRRMQDGRLDLIFSNFPQDETHHHYY